jgi:hypothetical protein
MDQESAKSRKVKLFLAATGISVWLGFLVLIPNGLTYEIHHVSGSKLLFNGDRVISYGWSKIASRTYSDGPRRSQTKVSGLCFVTATDGKTVHTHRGWTMTRSKEVGKPAVEVELD